MPLQSVLSPRSTLRIDPSKSFSSATVTVLTAPMASAASESRSRWGMMERLWGMVTLHPPKAGSLQRSEARNSSTVPWSALP